jgi:biotin synthase-related radical SAM superfamily protein
MSELKKQLYKELELKVYTGIEGLNFNSHIFKHLDLGGKYQEEIHCLFEMDSESHVGIKFPVGFQSPNGLTFGLRWNRTSPYSLEHDGHRYFLTHKGEELFPVEFLKRPKYYGLKTSDGTPMANIALSFQEGVIFIAYSNECALKEKGQDCKYCNINATRDTYADQEGIAWKYPKQIGETVAAAYKEGARHLTISGGFVPERREVEYYLDVADAIKEHTGLADFNGTACVGAPLDLDVIDKYKEAGYRTIATNIEIWDKNIFRSICPGKDQQCGGWDHWVKALEYEVQVFGHGRVRSNIVAGIEPKQSTLEGVEYLASKGVACFVSGWCPNPGSELEGHRSPEPAWHLDLYRKVAAIFRKAGFTYDQLYDCYAAPTSVIHDIYRIEDRLLPVFATEAAKQGKANENRNVRKGTGGVSPQVSV